MRRTDHEAIVATNVCHIIGLGNVGDVAHVEFINTSILITTHKAVHLGGHEVWAKVKGVY